MKTKLINQYQETLINIYPKEFIKSCPYDYIIVLKDLENSYEENNILFTSYQDFFHQFNFIYPMPPIRKPRKLLTYRESMDIIQRMHYGTLAIQTEIPYCVGLNHFIVDGHIYFHCGKQGYKLSGLNHLACYNVIEDLGIHVEAFTNNHQSIIVYGILKEVKENKQVLLDAFLQRYTPGLTKDLNEQVVENTMILELEIIHISGKKHYH